MRKTLERTILVRVCVCVYVYMSVCMYVRVTVNKHMFVE